MADRYQDRRLPAAGYDQGGDAHGSDPLAELARLIGQTDPFGQQGRATPAPAPPPRAIPREPYQQQYEPEPPSFEDDPQPSGPPPWMQRANAKAVQRDAPKEIPREIPREYARDIPRDIRPELPPQQDYSAPTHPLYRHAQMAEPDQDYVDEQAYDEPEPQLDPSRYDDALYGQLETGARDFEREAAYPDDPYAYQDDDDAEADERSGRRRGALVKLIALLVLAVVGTGSALAYRSYVGSKGSSQPPIIKADNSPTKIVPAPVDNTAKAADRMPSGDGTEKLVSREDAPVDINARNGGPRVVFPPLNPNTSPPTPSSVATTTMTSASNGPIPTNGTLPNNEPRKIKTFSVRGEQADSNAATPVGVPPPAAPPPPAAAPAKSAAKASRSVAPAAGGGGPISLTPEAPQAPAAPATRVATTASPAPVPATTPSAAASSGFLVSVSSQQSEADAQNSYRALQNKFPTQLGPRSPVIRRTDLGDKVVYRAMVGPFATADEAKQFCVDYKAAGGQCFVPRN
jgi:hypothetical protein